MMSRQYIQVHPSLRIYTGLNLAHFVLVEFYSTDKSLRKMPHKAFPLLVSRYLHGSKTFISN
jgi:hypothetical protein